MVKKYKAKDSFDQLIHANWEKEKNPKGWYNYLAWYFAPQIKFKMLPYLRDREFALMTPKNFPNPQATTRLLRTHTVQSFDFYYDVTGMKSNKHFYNFFSSVAKYKYGLPKVPYKKEPRQEFKEDWNKTHWKQMVSYDFFLDIDGTPDVFDFTKQSAIDVKQFFDNHGIPHQLRFSGKGFHFVIPYNYFVDHLPVGWGSFDPDSHESIYKFFGRLARYIHDFISEMVDSQIYDARRVIKIPYSLALYEHGYFVCLPISSFEELQTFQYTDAEYTKFSHDRIRYHKGDVLFNESGNVKYLIEEVIKKKYIKGVE